MLQPKSRITDLIQITADDYGLCREINDAVLLLHKKGIVSRASLIVNTNLFDESVKAARECPNLEMGIHLNLTDGPPTAPVHEVKSLLNKRGVFYGGRHYKVYGCALLGVMKPSEIKTEWRAQISKALNAGLRISHLNSHGHIHLLPIFHRIFIELVNEFDIPYIRLLLNSGSTIKEMIFNQMGRSLLRKISLENISCSYPIETIGIRAQGHLSIKSIKEDIQRVERKLVRENRGRVELICHPSIKKNTYHLPWNYDSERELDALLWLGSDNK